MICCCFWCVFFVCEFVWLVCGLACDVVWRVCVCGCYCVWCVSVLCLVQCVCCACDVKCSVVWLAIVRLVCEVLRDAVWCVLFVVFVCACYVLAYVA